MGSSQSRKKKENSLPAKLEDNQNLASLNHSVKAELISNTSVDSKIDGETNINSFSSVSKSSSTEKKKDIPKVDFSVYENENPIQRRRRIMSGDRRNCYVMKLGNLRQAQREQKLLEERKSSKCVYLKSLLHLGLQKNNSHVINLGRQSSKSSSISKTDTLKVCLGNEGDKNTDCKYYHCDEKNAKETTEFDESSSPERSEKASSKSSTNNKNQQSLNQIRNPSLSSRHHKTDDLSRNQANKSEVVNTVHLVQKQDKLCYPICFDYSAYDEIKLKPLDSKNLSVTYENEEIKNIEAEKFIKSSGNKIANEKNSQKSFINLFNQSIGIFEKCSGAGHIDNNKNFNTIVHSNSEIIPGFDSIITFESDYSVNGFESDIKTDFSTESIKNLKNKSFSVSTVGTCPSTYSFTTLMSYQKVKKLFKKRIAETEIEERLSTTSTAKNSHYNKPYALKELEELGRGHWKNDVWIPTGKLTKSIKHKMCSEKIMKTSSYYKIYNR